MKIAVGADHAGVRLKNQIRDELIRAGYDVADFGTNSEASTDYPDYARKVAESVAAGSADRGVLVCGTGVGMAIAANKVRGIRAAQAVDAEQVRLTRAHNNLNVLTFGARMTESAIVNQMIRVFLDTPFDGGRHARRVEKIGEIEGR